MEAAKDLAGYVRLIEHIRHFSLAARISVDEPVEHIRYRVVLICLFLPSCYVVFLIFQNHTTFQSEIIKKRL